MLSEDLEPTSHMVARMMITEAMELNSYEVIPGYHLNLKWSAGNPNRAVIPPEIKEEYYHEFDLRARKFFDYGLVEELYIEIGNEDDWDTRHSEANSSKYVYHKQMGNDAQAEVVLRMIKPDAILIRPSKGEVITFANAPDELFKFIMNLKKRYIGQAIAEAEAVEKYKKDIEKSSTKF